MVLRVSVGWIFCLWHNRLSGLLQASFILLDTVYNPRWRKMRLRPLQVLSQLRWRECDHRCRHPVGSNSHCVEAANAKDTETPSMRHPFDWRIVRYLFPG